MEETVISQVWHMGFSFSACKEAPLGHVQTGCWLIFKLWGGNFATKLRFTINYFGGLWCVSCFCVTKTVSWDVRRRKERGEEQRGEKTSETESSKTEPWANLREASSLINSVKTAKVFFMSILTGGHSFPWNLRLSDALPSIFAAADLQVSVMCIPLCVCRYISFATFLGK